MNAQRILRQKLEDLQKAGVSHAPAEMAGIVADLVEAQPVDATPKAVAAGNRRLSPADSARTTAAVTSSAKPVAMPNDSTVARPPRSPKQHPPKASSAMTKQESSTLSRDERETKLVALAERVAACQKCQELADSRTQTVFGVGNPEARILFIGEAPGADEDKQGEPFVGRAGKLLNDIIKAMTLTREEIYICNILRCRPPGNRNPSPTEADNCREFLDGQIETVNPEYIVCWGSVAAKNLLDTDKAIGKMRGQFYDYNGAKVLCTYHPSYLLRNPPAKKEVWKDMKFLMKDMGVEL